MRVESLKRKHFYPCSVHYYSGPAVDKMGRNYRNCIKECLHSYNRQFPGAMDIRETFHEAALGHGAIWAVADLDTGRVELAGTCRFVNGHNGERPVLEITALASRFRATPAKLRERVHALADFLETMAQRAGAGGVRFAGRPGWRRFFPDYATRQIVFEKTLDESAQGG